MNILKNTSLNRLLISFLIVRVALLLYGCANIARPGGGPKDEQAPAYEESTPLPGTLNYKGTKIEITFDENIELESAIDKVVVSPPQTKMPIISSNAHVVTVELEDTLIPNTTYTIDFSDAIKDLNEGNTLENFSFSFSTGDVIDTLSIAGMVLEASNLEPVTGILVGIQEDLADSAFYSKPFTRIAKTNATGHFQINNIRPGSYRIYALQDANNSYSFDMPTEDIAFLDSIIIPRVEVVSVSDTSWTDEKMIDTIIVHNHINYSPADLLLYSFNEEKKSRYFEKAERPDSNRVNLLFGGPNDTLPLITGLNFDATDWALVETSATFDTITYWIKDSTIYDLDTLKFSSSYLYTDTLNQLSPKVDTLSLYVRAKKPVAQKKKKKEDDEHVDSVPAVIPTVFIKLKEETSSSMDIGSLPVLIFDEPILSIEPNGVHVDLVKDDTVFVPQQVVFKQVEGTLRSYEVLSTYKPEQEYRLTIDSAAITGLYGLHNDKIEKQFGFKSIEEYSNLLFSVPNAPDSSFIELLTSSDEPAYKAWVLAGKAKFIHVNPGTYYARMVLDSNKNNRHDTGDYEVKRQPEQVYYYDKALELKANWDVMQDWDITSLPVTKQKPLDITKNKPDKKNSNR